MDSNSHHSTSELFAEYALNHMDIIEIQQLAREVGLSEGSIQNQHNKKRLIEQIMEVRSQKK